MFANRLKEMRAKAGLSQPKLADIVVGDPKRRQLVYEWEKGNGKPQDEETMRRLASALGTSISYLFGETDDPRPAPNWRSGKGAETELEERVDRAKSMLQDVLSVLERRALEQTMATDAFGAPMEAPQRKAKGA
jgi:transcriptional regulator with XRE-family HTH domain